jgi:tetratricopeptide (TPR) repeat protein
MRKLALAAAALSSAIPLSGAAAAVLTIGGPLSHLCYESAVAADGRSSAIDGCTRALQEESLATPDVAATYVNRGIVLMSGGRFDQADADFDSALKLRGNLPDGWLNKAFLRIRRGDGRGAMPLIQKAIDAGAGNRALVTFARGVAHEQMGELDAAYADLTRAREMAPRWALPRDYLASYRIRER